MITQKYKSQIIIRPDMTSVLMSKIFIMGSIIFALLIIFRF